MNVKLLLDENLSPKVAEILCNEDGIDACHVRDRGGLGTLDHEVLDLAYVEDRILVTSNVGDFVKLARARELPATRASRTPSRRRRRAHAGRCRRRERTPFRRAHADGQGDDVGLGRRVAVQAS